MLTLQISQADLAQVKYERFHYPCPKIQKRFEVLWLKALNLPHHLIATIADVSLNSVTRYIRLYNQEGLDAIKRRNYRKPESALSPHQQSLETMLRQSPPLSAAQAKARIFALTGIERSLSQVRTFMHRIGMKPRKLAQVPGKACPQAQQAFLDGQLDPLIEQARAGQCHLFFVDAAHFVLGFFLCTVWCFARCWIKSPAGRNRFNVLGALHAITLELEVVTNESYVNAQTVGQLLWQVRAKYTDAPLFLVMDNARYQRCRYVQELAEHLGIGLVFLPSYSPNLNLIERLWKFVKKQVLYGQYYERAALFREAIEECLGKVNHDLHYKQELKSLLTLQFQTFPNSPNLPV